MNINWTLYGHQWDQGYSEVTWHFTMPYLSLMQQKSIVLPNKSERPYIEMACLICLYVARWWTASVFKSLQLQLCSDCHNIKLMRFRNELTTNSFMYSHILQKKGAIWNSNYFSTPSYWICMITSKGTYFNMFDFYSNHKISNTPSKKNKRIKHCVNYEYLSQGQVDSHEVNFTS